MSLNLAVILRESALKAPNQTAVILDEFKVSYAVLDALSNQVASSLHQAGLRPGDRVGLMVPGPSSSWKRCPKAPPARS